ncbi:MAG: hypothetical protein Q8O04_03570 [Deltaproteobacteria bacterium]|nr:hypothetical protein [Deltaproteobacteria bacterium]
MPKESVVSKVLNWIVIIVAILIGRYSGISMLIPIIGASVVWVILRKVAPRAKQVWVPAIAVQAGHASWMIFGFLLLRELNANIADPIFLVGGLVWLYMRPRIGPLVLLGVFQAWGIAYNGYIFQSVEVSSPEHKALLVHIIFRVIALGAMAHAFYASRREARLSDSPPNLSLKADGPDGPRH